MKSYDVFLEYYDKIVRSINNPLEDEVEFLVEDCIKEYKPESKTILETACGTGEVARELIKKGYRFTGLDISEKMLEKAEKNLKPHLTSTQGEGQKVEFILGDMTDFDLGKNFDVVLCNYNSICHLLKWEDWQNFFQMTSNHLEKDGLFIFDINTLFEFENITRDFAQFYSFGNDTVCLEMRKTSPQPSPSEEREQEQIQGGFIYEWIVKIFKKRPYPNSLLKGEGISSYDLIEEVIRENSFAISKIEKELKQKGFKVLEKIDYHYGQVTAESERVYFICKKL